MPTAIEYEVVKQQCNSFNFLGYPTELKIQDMTRKAAPAITILAKGKTYKFSDPDWNVVSMQLAKLYKTIKGR